MKEISGFDWLQDYQINAPALVHAYGGKYIAIPGGFGNDQFHPVKGDGAYAASIVVCEFSALQAITDFLESPDYALYKTMRQADSISEAFAFENGSRHPV